MGGKNKVLVANGQGFWGDSILGPIRLVNEGPLDYLTLDYLAEVTMSIMQKLKSRNPEAGYATDFVKMVERVLPTSAWRRAFGSLPTPAASTRMACRARPSLKQSRSRGLSRASKIAVVEGDDILDQLEDLPRRRRGHPLLNMDTGEALSSPFSTSVSSSQRLHRCAANRRSSGTRALTSSLPAVPPTRLSWSPRSIHEFGWSPRRLRTSSRPPRSPVTSSNAEPSARAATSRELAQHCPTWPASATR